MAAAGGKEAAAGHTEKANAVRAEVPHKSARLPLRKISLPQRPAAAAGTPTTLISKSGSGALDGLGIIARRR